jgi:RimJ/RimL family protein N-acetyltransferase
LRDWSEADLPALTRWRNDVDLQGQLLARARGSSADQVREWVRERSCGPASLLQVIAWRDGNRAIGYLQLVGLDELDQCGELGICIEPRSQGAGVGREALELLVAYAPQLRPLRKLELRVRADNDRAIRCYEAVGFERCGALHRRTLVGRDYVDVLLMELFLPMAGKGVPPCGS